MGETLLSQKLLAFKFKLAAILKHHGCHCQQFENSGMVAGCSHSKWNTIIFFKT